MGNVTISPDPNWPSAASLLTPTPSGNRRTAALVGIHTYATSVTPRSASSTPEAVRRAFERYSTWSYTDSLDLAEHVNVVDLGDVVDPDGEGGASRVDLLLHDVSVELTIVLGGDNAATWLALRSLARGNLDQFGLVTLDAHLDLRDGVSNGSPVRQLLSEGLDGTSVVQVGLADFSNSPFYAGRAVSGGLTAITRHELRRESVEDAARRAVAVAAAGGKKVYVDIDVDVCDRSVVPGCPAAAPGGLSADELRRFVREIASHENVVAIDFTEVDVERDSNEQTVRLVALLVLESLAGLARRKNNDSHS